jgi:hypothetical protein
MLVNNPMNASCVMGALIEGWTGRSLGDMEAFYCTWADGFREDMPWLQTEKTKCPVCGWSGSVSAVAVCLNNQHQWTREAIGEWMNQFAAHAETPIAVERAATEQTPSPSKREAVVSKTPETGKREEELEEVFA